MYKVWEPPREQSPHRRAEVRECVRTGGEGAQPCAMVRTQEAPAPQGGPVLLGTQGLGSLFGGVAMERSQNLVGGVGCNLTETGDLG